MLYIYIYILALCLACCWLAGDRFVGRWLDSCSPRPVFHFGVLCADLLGTQKRCRWSFCTGRVTCAAGGERGERKGSIGYWVVVTFLCIYIHFNHHSESLNVGGLKLEPTVKQRTIILCSKTTHFNHPCKDENNERTWLVNPWTNMNWNIPSCPNQKTTSLLAQPVTGWQKSPATGLTEQIWETLYQVVFHWANLFQGKDWSDESQLKWRIFHWTWDYLDIAGGSSQSHQWYFSQCGWFRVDTVAHILNNIYFEFQSQLKSPAEGLLVCYVD